MLAFGVVIGGAFSSGGLGALANTIVVAVRPGVQQAAQVVTTVASGGGGGGGGGGHCTVAARERWWWRRRRSPAALRRPFPQPPHKRR